MDMEEFKINCYVLFTEIVVFFAFGTFGNLNVICATYRKSSLQNKSGLLLVLSCTFQQIALSFELVNATSALLTASGIEITRRQCYNIQVLFIFSICHQAGLNLALSFDLLLAIVAPIKYRTWPVFPYIALITLPSFIYSASITAWGFMLRDDQIVSFCNVALMLSPTVSKRWTQSSIAISSLVVVMYAVILALIKMRQRKRQGIEKETSRVLTRVTALLVVYVISYFAAVFGINMALYLGFDAKISAYIQSNMVIFTLICLSQTFYVCYWRSLEYRTAFQEQFRLITCRKIHGGHTRAISILPESTQTQHPTKLFTVA